MTNTSASMAQVGKRALLTGATGFIGVPLVSALRAQGWHVTALVRDYARGRKALGSGAVLVKSLDEIEADDQVDIIINLAGAGIADKRWTRGRKKQLLESRLHTTQALVQLIHRLKTKPAKLLSASAVGFYGASDVRALDENSAGGDEFTHELCKRWEQEAIKAEALGVSVCFMRLGVVFAAGGGMLGRLMPIFKLGLGGRTGSGQQYLSWIHRDDVLAAIQWLIATDSQGVYNLTAPEPVTNARFSQQLASAVHRPAWFPQPAALVQLMFGEMGERLLLNGQHVVPARLQREGFKFSYPTLELALAACAR